MWREYTPTTRRVLVADRETQTCRMMGILLECGLGVDVVEVEEADQAIAALRKLDLSLAVLDACTLGQAGLAAVQQIIRERPQLGVIICFSSASASEGKFDSRNALAEPRVASLYKPFRVAELLDTARGIQSKPSRNSNSWITDAEMEWDAGDERLSTGTGN